MAEGGGFLSRLRAGLRRTQEQLSLRLTEVFAGKTTVDDELYEELEAALLEADVGAPTTSRLLEALQRRVREERIGDASRVRAVLFEEIRRVLETSAGSEAAEQGTGVKPHVILVVGVNGVGKTTTIGKLARLHAAEGRRVVVGAADTFRAAAIEQLQVWVERAGARLVRHHEGADPAAVVYDALDTAESRDADVLIIDTAGRLHTKHNLMVELEKIHRVLGKRVEGAPHETLLILDATTGQNAVSQAREFSTRTGVTGLVVTKVDGTAKGGVVVAIGAELAIPVRYLGVGEGPDDLVAFDAGAFARALFDGRA